MKLKNNQKWVKVLGDALNYTTIYKDGDTYSLCIHLSDGLEMSEFLTGEETTQRLRDSGYLPLEEAVKTGRVPDTATFPDDFGQIKCRNSHV